MISYGMKRRWPVAAGPFAHTLAQGTPQGETSLMRMEERP